MFEQSTPRPLLLERAERISVAERQVQDQNMDPVQLTGTESKSGSCGGSIDDQ